MNPEADVVPASIPTVAFSFRALTVLGSPPLDDVPRRTALALLKYSRSARNNCPKS